MENKPEKALGETLSRVMYKRSSDPRHEQNAADPEWLAGYFYGCLTDNQAAFGSNEHDITSEWIERGKPKPDSRTGQRFTRWKMGFYSGRFRQISEQKRLEAAKST